MLTKPVSKRTPIVPWELTDAIAILDINDQSLLLMLIGAGDNPRKSKDVSGVGIPDGTFNHLKDDSFTGIIHPR